jgi:predicted HTH domain antitoxin
MENELIVSADFLEKAKITASELKIEVAIYLYEKKRLTLGQAKRLANLDQIAFQKELAKRNIYIHYSIEDFQKDLDNLGIQL